MEQDNNRKSRSGESSRNSSEMASRAREPRISFHRKIGRLLFGRGESLVPPEDKQGARLDDREAASYTLADFTKEQFFMVAAHFSAWYEVAKNPDAAALHPVVVQRFQDTLDPDDAQEIFAEWGEGLDELLTALESTHDLLEGDVELTDPRMEKVLSIMFHVDRCVNHLLEELDQSRSQES